MADLHKTLSCQVSIKMQFVGDQSYNDRLVAATKELETVSRFGALEHLSGSRLPYVLCLVCLFPTLGVGLLDFKVSYYSSPAETTSRDCLSVPNPTDYRETPWIAQPRRHRETPWSAQPHRLP